eukprot:TRINITY_DN9728_c0_g1_i1.p1 TRINITY_DN9728_c0_g1~~TRINITY_DN9728_c0_g1_i1.p1  ORF type:complete len:367 (+),score=38.67 TRINITY_DN9728_c0_g1_i1:146-1246(+)
MSHLGCGHGWQALAMLGRVIWANFLSADALRLEIMITSKWGHRERRAQQRVALGACLQRVSPEHEVGLSFFMGDMDESEEEIKKAAAEQEEFRDLVQVGGFDSDPPVARDATYVLDRPCARTSRLAMGTAWLVEHRPEFDFVMYLDDDSFLNLPRLIHHLVAESLHPQPESIAMGFVMETNLDWTDLHVCDVCTHCFRCLNDTELMEFCEQFPGLSPGGCVMAVNNCQIFNASDDTIECVLKTVGDVRHVSDYFGSKSAPRWLLGMGWVFGSRIVRYIGRNADRLKLRGAADVSLGFWLAPLEDTRFVPMNRLFFHDHPQTRSTFAAKCTDNSVLVHRMTPSRWAADFNADRCELVCSGREGSSET